MVNIKTVKLINKFCIDIGEENIMSIASDLIRGHTETIILAHLMLQDSYGYKINKAIQEKTNYAYELKEATLYSAFRRLEAGGFITSYWGDEVTGARRRYYKITHLGKALFEQNTKEWQQARGLIDKLIKVGDF